MIYEKNHILTVLITLLKKKYLLLYNKRVIAQKLLFANQYVRKWNVTCIASGQ